MPCLCHAMARWPVTTPQRRVCVVCRPKVRFGAVFFCCSSCTTTTTTTTTTGDAGCLYNEFYISSIANTQLVRAVPFGNGTAKLPLMLVIRINDPMLLLSALLMITIEKGVVATCIARRRKSEV